MMILKKVMTKFKKKKIKKLIGDKNIIPNIYRKQADGWIKYE